MILLINKWENGFHGKTAPSGSIIVASGAVKNEIIVAIKSPS